MSVLKILIIIKGIWINPTTFVLITVNIQFIQLIWKGPSIYQFSSSGMVINLSFLKLQSFHFHPSRLSSRWLTFGAETISLPLNYVQSFCYPSVIWRPRHRIDVWLHIDALTHFLGVCNLEPINSSVEEGKKISEFNCLSVGLSKQLWRAGKGCNIFIFVYITTHLRSDWTEFSHTSNGVHGFQIHFYSLVG